MLQSELSNGRHLVHHTHDLHVDVEFTSEFLLDLGLTSLSIDKLDRVSRSEILVTQFWNSSNDLIISSGQTVFRIHCSPEPSCFLSSKFRDHTEIGVNDPLKLEGAYGGFGQLSRSLPVCVFSTGMDVAVQSVIAVQQGVLHPSFTTQNRQEHVCLSRLVSMYGCYNSAVRLESPFKHPELSKPQRHNETVQFRKLTLLGEFRGVLAIVTKLAEDNQPTQFWGQMGEGRQTPPSKG